MSFNCSQCGRPAFFQIGGQAVYLCLDCNLKLTHIRYMDIEMLERESNYLAEQMEMTIGVRGVVPRYPPRQIKHVINQGDTILNNIKVENSAIGILNTGSIQTIDSSVTALNQSGQGELATAIRTLTEAVANTKTVEEEQRSKILEMLSVLASESTLPKEKRRKAAMGPLVVSLAEIIQGIDALGNIWAKYHPLIVSAFS